MLAEDHLILVDTKKSGRRSAEHRAWQRVGKVTMILNKDKMIGNLRLRGLAAAGLAS